MPSPDAITVDAITVEKLSFGFGKASMVLSDLSFALSTGGILAIMGPSGCGKTTLLRVLAGLLPPTTGTVSRTYKRLAFAYQSNSLFPWLTVRENVALPSRLQGVLGDDAIRAVEQTLEKVGMHLAASKYPHQLSGGMRKRVELARVLSWAADLWLLDEPFESLDPRTRLEMIELLRTHAEAQKATVILVTHGFDDALLLADRVLVLGEQGRLVAEVPVPLNRPRNAAHSDLQGPRADLLLHLSPVSAQRQDGDHQ